MSGARRQPPAQAAQIARQSGPRQHGWMAPALALMVAIGLFSLYPGAVQSVAVDYGAAWVYVTGAVAAGGLLVSRAVPASRVRLHTAWVAFSGWALVSALVSGRVWASLVGEPTNMLGWGVLVALGAVGVAGARASDDVSGLLQRYAWLVVLAQALLALATRVLAPAAIFAGTLPNSTYLGQALVLLLPWTLPHDRVARGPVLWGRYAAVAAALAALAATGSRVALVVALAWAVWATITRSSLTARRRFVITAVVLSLVAVFGLAFARDEIVGSADVATLGERPQMWQLAALAIAERPVLGWGPDGFVAGGAAVSTPEIAEAGRVAVLRPGSTDPHNLVVWLAVSTGAVGLALFGWFAVEMVRAWRQRGRAGGETARGVWAVAGCVVVMLTAPATVHVLPLLSLVAGASVAMPARDTMGQDTPLTPSARAFASSLVAVAFLACAVLGANVLTRSRYEVASAERSPALAAGALSASRLWRTDAHLAYLTSLHTGWAAMDDPAYALIDLDTAARAVSLDTRNAFYALEYARTLRHYGETPERIEAAFAEVFRRYPLYPVARAEYAVLLAQNGRVADAREQIAIAGLVNDADPARLGALEAAEAAIAGQVQ